MLTIFLGIVFAVMLGTVLIVWLISAICSYADYNRRRKPIVKTSNDIVPNYTPTTMQTNNSMQESTSDTEVTAPGKHVHTSYEEIEACKVPDNADEVSDKELQTLAWLEAEKQAEEERLRALESSIYG